MVRVAHSSDGKFVVTCGPQFLRRYIYGDSSEPVHYDFECEGHGLDVTDDKFAVACSDGSVKLYSLEDIDSHSELYGGSFPVRDVRFSSDGQWVSVCAEDKAAIVNVDDITNIQSLGVLARHASWHPEQSFSLGISGQDSTLSFYSDESVVAKMDSILPAEDVAGPRSTYCAWSPAGDLFGIPSKSFDFVIYDTEHRLEQFRLIHKEPIIEYKWCPNGLYVACLLNSGSIFVWQVHDRKTVMIEKLGTAVHFDWHPNDNIISWVDQNGILNNFVPVPSDLESPNGVPVVQDLKRSRDEEDLILSGESEDFDDEDDLFVDGGSAHKRARVERVDERAFQSGSTPWFNRKRLLCTNYVGYVWTTFQDNDHNTVTISFFDQGEHRDITFEDSDKYEMAALTNSGALFASKQGKVFMRFHNSRSDSWECECEESISAVALSEDFVVVCTASGYMKYYSIYGNLITVNRDARDPVLTCAAVDNIVMTVRSGVSGRNYSIEDPLTGQYFQKNDSVPVSADQSLTSLFFSEAGDPCIGDSAGVVSTLTHWRDSQRARWVPIFSSEEALKDREHPDKFWPFGVFESKLLCFIVKGEKNYPTIPLPVSSQVDLKVPGVEGYEQDYILLNTTLQQTEEKYEQSNEDAKSQLQLEIEDAVVEADKILLRQLQAACQESRANRALAITQLIRNPDSTQVAAEIALRYNMHSLAERLQG